MSEILTPDRCGNILKLPNGQTRPRRLTDYRMVLTEPQARFMNLGVKFPAFVGGFGTGKSETMAKSALMDAREGGSGSLIALYEPTYDLVRLIMAPRMMETLSAFGYRYRYNKSENIIYTSSGNIGDFVLRAMMNPDRIVGYQSMRAHVDELDTLPTLQARDVWRKIIARNRQRPRTWRRMTKRPLNSVSAYTTPEGFGYVYEMWAEDRAKAEAKGYKMVQAATLSNPYLPLDYVPGLLVSYPPELVKAYILGQFTNLASGTIYYTYDVAGNRSREEVQPGEPLFIGMDFNVQHMSAIVHVIRDGKPHAVAEFVDRYDTPDMIEAIIERYGNGHHQINIYPDSSGKNRKTSGASTSDIALLEGAGFMVHYEQTNPAVKSRINAVNAMFLNAAGERRYFVNDLLCPWYSKCLQNQIYDEKTGEPDKKSGFDHANDAGGYYIAYTFPIIRDILPEALPDIGFMY